MNLVLFESSELTAPIPRADPRIKHILDTLRLGEGKPFDAGVINGPRGKALLLSSENPDAFTIAFTATHTLPSPRPLALLIGLPRPQTARDILRDATTLGATRIHFVATERADPNYATSTLWTTGEWRRHCLAGAAQAFDTFIPEVTWTNPLAAMLASLPPDARRIALDNYEATTPLAATLASGSATVIALGPERGWGPADRSALRAAGFILAHLGPRVLRVETAVVAALAMVQNQLPKVG